MPGPVTQSLVIATSETIHKMNPTTPPTQRRQSRHCLFSYFAFSVLSLPTNGGKHQEQHRPMIPRIGFMQQLHAVLKTHANRQTNKGKHPKIKFATASPYQPEPKYQQPVPNHPRKSCKRKASAWDLRFMLQGLVLGNSWSERSSPRSLRSAWCGGSGVHQKSMHRHLYSISQIPCPQSALVLHVST